uniref:RRM domain-containing protein n=1 Tax=Quercus lobata TaxID=97700 RepID=A0A7N2KLX2_QUELO
MCKQLLVCKRLIFFHASEEDLELFCGSIGEVTEVRIVKGKDSGENKGFAFVTFRSAELTSKAFDELNNTEFNVT